ncbi:MAG TPA: hypothetical protein VF629_11530 [Hymenobacter sp.]|uniref:hypothetical protein n=1 Tax=Hymenobacter sp. TaxID=1898978 RepID=UPI002ED78B45
MPSTRPLHPTAAQREVRYKTRPLAQRPSVAHYLYGVEFQKKTGFWGVNGMAGFAHG